MGCGQVATGHPPMSDAGASTGGVIVAFGPSDSLVEAVTSLVGQVDVLVVVNNGAPAAVLAGVAALGARIIGDGSNLGFGRACNLGAAAVGAETVVFMNPDCVAQGGAVGALCGALDDDVWATTACVVHASDPTVVNAAGVAVHVLGFAWANGNGEPTTAHLVPRSVASVSGAAFAMRRARFSQIGGFCEEIFLYHEDTELSLRILGSGGRVLYVPDAVVHHDYAFASNPGTLGYLERHRAWLVLTHMPGRTLLRILPFLVVAEAMVTALAVKQGWLPAKCRGWLWTLRRARRIVARRRELRAAGMVVGPSAIKLLATRWDADQVVVPAQLAPLVRLFEGAIEFALR